MPDRADTLNRVVARPLPRFWRLMRVEGRPYIHLGRLASVVESFGELRGDLLAEAGLEAVCELPDLFVGEGLAVAGLEAVDGEIGAFDVVQDRGQVVERELFADGAEAGGGGRPRKNKNE